ncbi:MAG: hypothetical protein MUF32_01700, partial [Burkholderiaceae bacterium]|nr:hypothetical protein [Burkholderiaceae bacterium]
MLLRSLATATASLLLTAALLAAAAGWLLGTTHGMNSLIALVNRLAPLTIETEGAFGALAEEFGFATLKVTVAGEATVQATSVRARLRGGELRPPRLEFAYLEAASLRVDVVTDDSPLLDIGVPLALSTDRAALGRLTVVVDGTDVQLQSIAGRATAGPGGYRVEGGTVALGAHTARLDAELGARAPFPLRADGKVAAQLQDRAIDAEVRVRGSLTEMAIDGELSGAARGTLAAVVASFEKPAVRSLSFDLAGVDPRFWHPAAPVADLALKGRLTPNAAMDRVAGDVAVENRAPGLLDAGRIPARRATAQVEIDARQLRFERVSGQLLQGSVSGEYSVAFADGSWQSSAQLADVDPARLHGALQPLRLDGRIQARRTTGGIFVTADLASRSAPAAALVFDGSFTSTRATINSARLSLGEGFATAAGSVELAGAYRAELQGSLQQFEPGRLVKGIDARLNGDIVVDGVLKPRPAGRIRFDLANSRAWGRPLSAHGRVEIDAGQRLDVDIDLAVRSARLLAKGGLGGERSVEVTLDVPSIAELVPSSRGAPLAGALKLQGSARGQWPAPAFALRLAGSNLRYGEHTLEGLDADARYGGGDDGEVHLDAGATLYRYAPQPRANLQSLSLAVEGRLSSHAIRLDATADKKLAASAYADGGWRQDSWHGRLREAVVGPPFDLRLLTPAALVAGPRGVHFGPAQFAVQHVRVDDVRFRVDDAGMATQGNFSGLQPARFSRPVEGGL